MTHHAYAILGLLAETSIHAGAGQSAGTIDLPIQREAHTDWPCVFGSAVKGALRTRAEDLPCSKNTAPNADNDRHTWQDTVYAVFGPDTDNASDHAGALMIGDARLVLMPVRSLTTHFKWVTCPALLDRLRRDAERLGLEGFSELRVDQPTGAGQGLSSAWSANGEPDLFLEEYRFQANPLPNKKEIVDALSGLADRDEFGNALLRQLVVVEDDVFRDLCRHATPVNAHVRLTPETKTVQRSALWYEETLPSETLFYVALGASRARRRRKDNKGEDLGRINMSAQKVMEVVTDILFGKHPYLQLGGNETVGMGWCRVKPIPTAAKKGV